MSLTVASEKISEGLLIEILTRLPMKSLMRFKCVSKLCLSIISSRYMTNLFLQSSSSRQRLFAYLVISEPEHSKCELVTSTSHDHSEASVSVMDQDLTLPGMGGYFVSAIRGLVCFTFENTVRICNPNTRQDVELPVMRSEAVGNIFERNYSGYDHVHDEYNVLNVVSDFTKELTVRSEHQVLILGPGASWKKIQCHIPHASAHCFHPRGMAINGVLYYGAFTGACSFDSRLSFSFVLMSFDLRSEEFNVIRFPWEVSKVGLSYVSLMNYEGKVAFLDYNSVWRGDSVDVWVLEDAEKSEWLDKKTFVLPLHQTNIVPRGKLKMGATSHSGKVWLAKEGLTHNQQIPVRFFIYDLEKNEITQKIEIRPLPYGTQLSRS